MRLTEVWPVDSVQKPATTAAVQQRDIEAYWKQRNAALESTGSQNVITQAAALRDGASDEGVREAFSLVAKKNEELGHTFSHVKVSRSQERNRSYCSAKLHLLCCNRILRSICVCRFGVTRYNAVCTCKWAWIIWKLAKWNSGNDGKLTSSRGTEKSVLWHDDCLQLGADVYEDYEDSSLGKPKPLFRPTLAKKR